MHNSDNLPRDEVGMERGFQDRQLTCGKQINELEIGIQLNVNDDINIAPLSARCDLHV